MKKKRTLRTIGIILTAISGSILTVATGGLFAVPAVLITTASVTGAVGTAFITIDANLEKETE